MTGPSAYLLKVFSGPHVGAEILLAEGEYVIGSSDACDVIFNDRFIAARHASLTLSRSGVKCVPLESAGVFVGGQRLEPAGRILQPFEFFTLGNTHVALGPENEPWPQIEFPEFQLNTAPVPEPVPLVEPAAAEAPPPEPEVPPEPVPVEPAPQKPRRRIAWIAVAVLLLLCAPLIWGVNRLWGSPAQPPEVTATDEARLRDIARQYARTGAILTVQSRHGRWHLEGFVQTHAERQAITAAVQTIGPGLRCRVFDNESLTAAVGHVLAGTSMPLHTRSGPPGEVVVWGEGRDPARWKEVQQRIRDDVPMLRKLDDQVVFAVVRKPEPVVVRPEVAAPAPEVTGPPIAVTLPPDPPGDVVPEPESDVPVPEDTGTVAGEAPDPESPAEPLKQLLTSLDFVSVSIGSTACVTLPGGQRYFEGAVVGDGFRIQSITPRAIVLARGDEQRVLPLGGAHDTP